LFYAHFHDPAGSVLSQFYELIFYFIYFCFLSDLRVTLLSGGVSAQLDTNWCVGAVMEKKLQPFPFTFALSGWANHVKAQYRFGIGLIVG
jgi:hypothetical protein